MAYHKNYAADAGNASYATVVRKSYGVGVAGFFAKAARTIYTWYGYHKTVNVLSGLSNHTLKDIGIERSQIPWVAHTTAMKIDEKRYF
jgi:uncharacterized protein YjiS (DUF1127 family)